MGGIIYGIVIIAFIVAAVRHLGGFGAPAEVAPMEALGKAMIDSAGSAVTLALGLVGVMALFLGLMKIAERGGLLVVIARTLRPLMVRLFPEVPADHPAMGAMILNISANVLGLGNAATPFGIRAMQELDKLNPVKGTASNAMALFVAINTSSVTILPTGVVAVRAALGSEDPAGVVPTTLFATGCSTIVAIAAAKFLQRRFKVTAPSAPAGAASATAPEVDETIGDPTDTSAAPPPSALDGATGREHGYPAWVSGLVLAFVVGLIPLMIFFGSAIAPWIIPGLMVALMTFGVIKRVRIYEAFIEGAAEGFRVALRIIPYLVAILVAVAMFRSSGALDLIFGPIGAATSTIGLPAEGLIMAILRSLSGSGAYGYMTSVLQDPAIGPDSYTGYLVSTIQGSTETTFYVLAVYFGAVQIRRVRHALAAGLIADIAGLAAAVLICTMLFGAA